MPAAVGLRLDWDAKRVRAAARETKDADQARRLLAIAAAYEGQDRAAAAKLGAMDPQRVRDWGRRFNEGGAGGVLRGAPGVIEGKPGGAARRRWDGAGGPAGGADRSRARFRARRGGALALHRSAE